MSRTPKTKPCPFCGGRDLDIQTSTEDSEGIPMNVICNDCGARGPWLYVPDVDCEALAYREWDKRV